MPDTRVLCEGLRFGEGPRWHGGRLWLSDFHDRAVKTVDADGTVEVAVQLDDLPSGLGWLPDGRLLIVSQLRKVLVRREADGSLVDHADLSPHVQFSLNDMVVDAVGRAYVGNPGLDLGGSRDEIVAAMADPPTTVIVRVDPDGSTSIAADGLVFPNGTVVTPDGATLIVAESLAGRLRAFDVAADGALSGSRVWADLPGVAPDGICLDAEGCVWVANANAAECVRVREGGEIVQRVETSQPAFACVLGGHDGHTLHAVTAPTFIPAVVAKQQAGKVEVVDVAVASGGSP